MNSDVRATLNHSLAVTTLNGVKASRFSQWWHGRRRHATPPPRADRAWIHPSELPNFDALLTPPIWQLRSRGARAVAAVMALALIAGALGLTLTHNSSAAAAKAAEEKNQAAVQAAAAHTVDLTITTPGHVAVAAAMVLPDDLAVTTTAIPANATITGSMPSRANVSVKWVGRDEVMGFSIVRLEVPISALTFAPLPASPTVVAVSPLPRSSGTPRYAWADTTLGDPHVDSTGVISYLATKTDSDINGFTDGVAVNQAGDVVAVLSTNHLWYSAQFVAHIADIVATGHGCHSSLGIVGTNAQGGGVLVSRIVPKSPAQWLLHRGDVVTTFNGKSIETKNDLLTALYLTPAFTRAHVAFVRNASVHHTVMTLGCAL